MALKPLGDRIIVRFEETEEKTASGFVLAGASHETTKTAEVLAVGEGTRTLTGELDVYKRQSRRCHGRNQE